jgi:hypothetical protein
MCVTYYLVVNCIKELVLECIYDDFLECLIDVVVSAIYACRLIVRSVSFCDSRCHGIVWVHMCGSGILWGSKDVRR